MNEKMGFTPETQELLRRCDVDPYTVMPEKLTEPVSSGATRADRNELNRVLIENLQNINNTGDLDSLELSQTGLILANRGLIRFMLDGRRDNQDNWLNVHRQRIKTELGEASTIDRDDMTQVLNIALMHAATKWNSSSGANFSSYTMNWLKQATRHCLDVRGHTIHIPRQILEERRSANRTELFGYYLPPVDALTDEHQLPYTVPLGFRPDTVDNDDDDEAIYRRKFLPDTDLSLVPDLPESAIAITDEALEDALGYNSYAEHTIRVLGIVSELDERAQNIIFARFGFNGDVQTLEKIGEKYGVTRERIRQIEDKAIKQIRLQLAEDDAKQNKAQRTPIKDSVKFAKWLAKRNKTKQQERLKPGTVVELSPNGPIKDPIKFREWLNERSERLPRVEARLRSLGYRKSDVKEMLLVSTDEVSLGGGFSE